MHKKVKIDCPYLETIQRHLLDFDLIYQCKECLSQQNIYCCLTCGNYFEGIGITSHAWIHSLEFNHYLFISTGTQEVFCIPDNYKVHSDSLEDIKFNLKPTYSLETLKSIESQSEPRRSLNGSQFTPGLIPLNNLKSSTYANSILYLLFSIRELREHLILNHYSGLTKSLGDIFRKTYNPKSFKSHICPHEFFQIVSNSSNNKFNLRQQSDPQVFLQWIISQLHSEGFVKRIIKEVVRGKIEIKGKGRRFLHFKLELPKNLPFVNDEEEEKVELVTLLEEYLEKEGIRISKLPKYLILMFNKFQHNGFFEEKSKVRLNFGAKLEIDGIKYHLCYALTLEPDTVEKVYHCSLLHIDRWHQFQDITVKPTLEQSVFQKDPYILLYKR